MFIQKICAGFETTLAAKLLAGGTSFSLSSHLTKKGVELSGEYGFILGEGTAVEEWCYGTVVSGVVTIIKRGLDPEDPNVEVSALKFDHDRGSSVKITDYPFLGFLREYLAGTTPLPAPLKYETPQTPTEDSELIDKKYADDLFTGAIGTASNSTAGGIKTDKANNGKPRTYQTLVQEQATPDMTLKVLPFKVAVNEKIVDYAGGNTSAFTAPVTNPRIDLLVYDTAGSALAIRAGSEAASPSAPAPTSGDIILAEIYHKVGETSVKETNDTINGYIYKWFIPNLYRTDLAIADTIPVFENLTQGDLLKMVNDSGTFKVAKIIGIKSLQASAVSKTGNIVKIRFASDTKVIILTDTPKLYVADWNGTIISNLVDITQTTCHDFDIIDTNKIGYCKVSGNVVSCGAIDVSGSPAPGGEVTILNTAGVTTPVMVAINTNKFVVLSNWYASNWGHSYANVITVSGTTCTSGAQSEYVGQLYQGTTYYYRNMIVKVDTDKFAFVRSSTNGWSHAVWYGVVSGNAISSLNAVGFSSTSGGVSGSLLAIDSAHLLLFWNDGNGNTKYFTYLTITGATPAITSSQSTTLITTVPNISIYKDGTIYIQDGSWGTYRLTFDFVNYVLYLNKFVTVGGMLVNLSSQKYLIAFSNDTAVKTSQTLLDHGDFIGIADRAYSITENFSIKTIFYGLSSLIYGADYYIGSNGQSLSLANTYKKVGRAISDAIIIKE